MDAFGFYDNDLSYFFYNRAVFPCCVMVKFKDSSAVIGNADGSEGKALANPRKVEDIPIRGNKGDVGICSQLGKVRNYMFSIQRQLPGSWLEFFFQMADALFFHAFLNQSRIGGEKAEIFHVSFNGKYIIGKNTNIIEDFSKFCRMPPS